MIFEVVVGGDGDWNSGRPDGGGSSMYQFSCPMVCGSSFGYWWERLGKYNLKKVGFCTCVLICLKRVPSGFHLTEYEQSLHNGTEEYTDKYLEWRNMERRCTQV